MLTLSKIDFKDDNDFHARVNRTEITPNNVIGHFDTIVAIGNQFSRDNDNCSLSARSSSIPMSMGISQRTTKLSTLGSRNQTFSSNHVFFDEDVLLNREEWKKQKKMMLDLRKKTEESSTQKNQSTPSRKNDISYTDYKKKLDSLDNFYCSPEGIFTKIITDIGKDLQSSNRQMKHSVFGGMPYGISLIHEKVEQFNKNPDIKNIDELLENIQSIIGSRLQENCSGRKKATHDFYVKIQNKIQNYQINNNGKTRIITLDNLKSALDNNPSTTSCWSKFFSSNEMNEHKKLNKLHDDLTSNEQKFVSENVLNAYLESSGLNEAKSSTLLNAINNKMELYSTAYQEQLNDNSQKQLN